MTQMNVSRKQKQTYRHREETYCCQGAGEGWLVSWGLADADYYIENE